VEDGANKPDETFVFTRVKPTTREDFEEYCKLNEGRWVGDVTLIADWPGVGKKGQKLTAYYESTIAQDGNALIAKNYTGKGSGTSLTVFDTSTNQIKGTWVSTGGSISHYTLFRRDGKWMEKTTGSNPNGDKIVLDTTFTYSDNGTKCIITSSGTVGDDKTKDQYDVWRKVSK